MEGADRSRDRNEEAAYDAQAGLREGILEIPKLRSRELKVFGTIEVAYHRFLPARSRSCPSRGRWSTCT